MTAGFAVRVLPLVFRTIFAMNHTVLPILHIARFAKNREEVAPVAEGRRPRLSSWSSVYYVTRCVLAGEDDWPAVTVNGLLMTALLASNRATRHLHRSVYPESETAPERRRSSRLVFTSQMIWVLGVAPEYPMKVGRRSAWGSVCCRCWPTAGAQLQRPGSSSRPSAAVE